MRGTEAAMLLENRSLNNESNDLMQRISTGSWNVEPFLAQFQQNEEEFQLCHGALGLSADHSPDSADIRSRSHTLGTSMCFL